MQIGWVDFSKTERDKVVSILRLLGTQTALDELGIGTVRDAFSDMFFPGISTLQTRAKYFVILPYLFAQAENHLLSVYRLTLGQPRQEELFETIHKENWNMDELKKLYINLSPWNRAHHNGGTEHED